MLRRLLLVAHAETDATRHAVFADGCDLNAAGAGSLSGLPALVPAGATILSSPALAARSTAACLGQADVEDALRDLDTGAWSGRSLAEIADHDPEGLARWIAKSSWAGHGGESVDALVGRIGGWLDQRRALPGITVAVTHAAVVRAALVATLEAPGAAFWRIEVPPLACLTLGTDGRRWSLRALETGAPRAPSAG